MDTELLLLVAAGCVAVIIIALSAKLSGRKRESAKIAPQVPVQRDDNALFEQFKRLTAEQPNNPDLWLRWGKELVAAADAAKHPNMRLHRYNEACSCFQSATDIDPGRTVAWQSWGQSLYSLYKMQGCEDRLTLDNAHTKFQTAVRLAPADAALWQHWGEELYMAASHCQQPEQRHELQDLADAKFAKAVEINPELILEWKRWRSESADQRVTAQASVDLEAAAGSENSPASPSAASPDEDRQPALPWARGAATPVEASTWLTNSISPDNAPNGVSPGNGSSGSEPSAAGPKPDAPSLLPDPSRPDVG